MPTLVTGYSGADDTRMKQWQPAWQIPKQAVEPNQTEISIAILEWNRAEKRNYGYRLRQLTGSQNGSALFFKDWKLKQSDLRA